jgi:IPT/TIG domain
MNRRSPRQARFEGRRQPAAAVIAVLLLIGLLAASPAMAARSKSWATLRQSQLASLSAPEVGNVAPYAGPPSGGTLVGIGGKHFTGAVEVRFGATPATSFTVKSDIRIEAIAPPGSEGRVDVTVTTPEGTSAVSRADHFTYVPPGPYVTELAPEEGMIEGGHPVKIIGAELAGATEVTFGGAPAAFEVLSAEAIEATSPPGTAPVVDVRVETPAGTSPVNPGDRYTYLGAFIEISKVTRNKGPAAGGSTVAIAGQDFYGVTAVDFGGVPAPSFTVNSPGSITATSPAHTAGKIMITVQTTFGPSLPEYCAHNKGRRERGCVFRDYYTFTEPTIATVSPGSGPTAGGTSVTITGTGFAVGSTGTEVLFGKVPATSVDCTSDTTCTAVSPPATKPSTAFLKVTVRSGGVAPHSKKNPAAKFVYG